MPAASTPASASSDVRGGTHNAPEMAYAPSVRPHRSETVETAEDMLPSKPERPDDAHSRVSAYTTRVSLSKSKRKRRKNDPAKPKVPFFV